MFSFFLSLSLLDQQSETAPGLIKRRLETLLFSPPYGSRRIDEEADFFRTSSVANRLGDYRPKHSIPLPPEASCETMHLIIYSVIFILLLALLLNRWKKKKFLETEGRVLFITGCDSGIGKRLALHFAAKGCDVFAGCLKPEEARHVFPSNVRVVYLDISKPDIVEEAVCLLRTHLEQQGSELWCLINNAGVCTCGEFDWLTAEQCDRLVQVNLLGTMRITKSCLPLLRKSRGRLVTITSVNGFVAYPGLSVYSATKFALEGLNDALRIELRQHGVSVVLVQPGDLARLTSIMAGHQIEARRMWDAMSEDDRRQYGSYFKKYHESVVRNYGLSSPAKFEDSTLLTDVEHAVFSGAPEPRYLSAPLVYRVGYKLLVALPSKWRDILLERIASSVLHR